MGSWTWQLPLVNSGVFVKVTQFPTSKSVSAWTAKVTGVEAHLKQRMLVLAKLICRSTTLRSTDRGQRHEKTHRLRGLELVPHFGVRQFGKNSSCRHASLAQEQIVAVQGEQSGGRPQEMCGVSHGARELDGVSRITDGFLVSPQCSHGSCASFKTHHYVLRAPTCPAF